MPDSSSEDEERIKLMQALDTEFISDELYGSTKKLDQTKTGDGVKSVNSKPSLPPSLRYTDEQEDQTYNLAGLNLTPEFQKFVAKHLSSLLDQQMKEVKFKKSELKKLKKNKNNGVRLLSSSSSYVVVTDYEDISVKHNAKRKLREVDVDSEEEYIKIAETAVSPEWVLSGEATRGWVKSTRGELILGGKLKKKKKKKKKSKSEQCKNE